MAVAHELCHVVLNGMRHPLQSQEEVVDLTAMMLGFRDFYMTGCTYVLPGNDPQRINIMRQGYLTTEEVGYAAHHMTFR